MKKIFSSYHEEKKSEENNHCLFTFMIENKAGSNFGKPPCPKEV